VDWVEADIWWHYGRLDARHEHALWRLPVRYDEWKLGLALRSPLRLEEICDRLSSGPRLLIDFKGEQQALSLHVVDLLQRRDAVGRAAICGQIWPLLDLAREREPALKVFYSIGSNAQIEELRRRGPALPAVRAVSCAESLLTAQLLSEMAERGIEVFAWTVNDMRRAQELTRAGVAESSATSTRSWRRSARRRLLWTKALADRLNRLIDVLFRVGQ
jgi:hypothetical protein